MRYVLVGILLTAQVGFSGGGEDSSAPGDPFWNGKIRAYGALRAIYHEGEIGTTVTLDEMLPGPDVYALGALTDLAGEITVIGGNVFLSSPEGSAKAGTQSLEQSDAGATLLVSARVPEWIGVTTKKPVPFEEIDEAIAELAQSVELNADHRFPFLIKGEFDELRYHVIDGSRLSGGGSSHHDHLEASTRVSVHDVSATLIGFYSTSDQGVFTHRGSATHIHCVLEEPLASGHVDHVVIPAGTTVLFPQVTKP